MEVNQHDIDLDLAVFEDEEYDDDFTLDDDEEEFALCEDGETEAAQRQGKSSEPPLTAGDIFEAGGPRRAELEARTLAGELPKTIAQHIGVTPEVVKAYEQAYFSFRDSLPAYDYIITFAIRMPATTVRQASPAEAFVRWLGYGAGPVMLDEIKPLLPVILSWDDSERLCDPLDVNTFEGMLLLRLRVLFRVQTLEMSGPLGGLATKNLQEVQVSRDGLAIDIQTLAAAENQQNEDRAEDRVVDGHLDVYQQVEQEVVIFAQ